MKIKIYCNYGVLAVEKRNVYTYGNPDSAATCWDEIAVETPEGWEPYENYMGELMVTAPWGMNYTINEVLQGNEKPCFYALDKSMNGHRQYLRVLDKEEKIMEYLVNEMRGNQFFPGNCIYIPENYPEDWRERLEAGEVVSYEEDGEQCEIWLEMEESEE